MDQVPKDSWLFKETDAEISFPLSKRTALKISMYHHELHGREKKESAKLTADEIILLGRENGLDMIIHLSISQKIMRMHGEYQNLKKSF